MVKYFLMINFILSIDKKSYLKSLQDAHHIHPLTIVYTIVC
jgi:hypothetical protein